MSSKRSGKIARISFYGNFGAGNLGNECTLQAVIEQTRRRWPDAQLLCSAQIRGMCGHATTLRLFPEAIDKTAAKRSGGRSPRGRLGRILRKATDFGLAQYLLPLANLSTDVLIGRFKQLENNMERLDKYRQALDALLVTVVAESDATA
jgi:polysaccharide pyruvyl transferase WcaK-like protein